MEKKVFKLPKNHGWRCKPGHKIFVMDRGAVRFDYPQDWILLPGATFCKFHNKRPPDDDCLLEVSFFRLTPSVDWSGLPLAPLLCEVLDKDGVSVSDDQIVRDVRDDLELVWVEYRVIDPNEHREAAHRMCMGRTRNTRVATPGRAPVLTRPDIQALITLAFWPEHSAWVDPAWKEVLRSLQLGVMIKDPTGPSLH